MLNNTPHNITNICTINVINNDIVTYFSNLMG